MKKLVLILLFLGLRSIHAQTYSRVSAEEFKKSMENKKGILIDLRTSDEIKSKGTIKGSQQIDYLAKDSEKVIEALDKNKTYYIFCAGGGRSGDCLELMQKAGFKEVVELEKGFDNWKSKGFDVQKTN
ncbi:MAG: Rhodanese-like protein [Bacteroidetes bacterium]|nr:Rhodanese-like protein [Bacteroidota bacterium]